MKHHWHLYGYWLLLLAPALAIGLGAVYLLRRVTSEMTAATTAAREREATAQARLWADQIGLATRAVQGEFTADLARLQDAAVIPELRRWDRENPLVRNVFLWEPETGLAWPDPRAPENAEQFRFIMRYEQLFSGRRPWTPMATGDAPANAATSSAQIALERTPPSALAAPARSGWLAWFSADRLHLLGWVQPRAAGPVRGIELETVALLARLVAVLPPSADWPADEVVALLDGNGDVLHQVGAGALTTPVVRVPVGPALPHWEVAYRYRPAPAPVGTGAWFLLGAGLIALLVLAIASGGFALLWQARRSRLEALRKTSFVANVSHELKTPLTSIRMYAELLGEARITDEDKRARYLAIIATESQRLSRLVNNVLDFSRLEQGRKQYAPEAVAPAALVREVLAAHAPRIADAGLAWTVEATDAAPTVCTDRDAIEQVLVNLIDNACKYAAEGGELVVRVTTEGPQCHIAVLDRGPGVPGGERERIFTRFHRLDDQLTSRQPGVGLGLSISRRLLRDQGGDLVCHARAGGGSSFVITLPLAAPSPLLPGDSP